MVHDDIREEYLQLADPPCLCLCDLLGLAVLVADLGPLSGFLSNIMTSVAPCIAIWLTNDCIDFDSAILTCILSIIFCHGSCFFWSGHVCLL